MSERAALPPVPFIGLTGAVASGKSEALEALARLGAQTLSTDAVVHELLASEEVAGRIAERWGEEAAPEGEVDRATVGAIVFERPEELRWLEQLLHPRVGERVAAWRAALPSDAPLAVVEVPLLFESGMDAGFDATVVITAADEVRRARARERGTAYSQGRGERQLTQEEKAARANWVIANDGTPAELEARLAELLPRLRDEVAR